MKKLSAFKGDPKIKADLLAQLQAHYEADEIIQGVYWENGKGCAIGCTVHGANHHLYRELWDIPVQLAALEESIFEDLSPRMAKKWPIQFIEAINVGAHLSDVHSKFWEFMSSEKIRFGTGKQTLLCARKLLQLISECEGI